MPKKAQPSTGPGKPVTEELVLTPGGWRPVSKVHAIERGHHLSGAGGRLKEIETSSHKVLRDFGAIPKSRKGKAEFARSTGVPKHKMVASVAGITYGSGWITYAGWTNNSGSPINFFTTQWTVPPVPANQSGQTIFLFNGIQNSAFILQPVLQWGVSAAGGGPYWAVSNWYVDGQGGQAKYSPLVRVNPGDALVGVMRLTGQNGDLFSYSSSFDNIPNNTLDVADIEELTWANETLEAYSITSCADYPNTQMTAMTAIALTSNNGALIPAWIPATPVNECGQHNAILNNGQEVDLYYH